MLLKNQLMYATKINSYFDIVRHQSDFNIDDNITLLVFENVIVCDMQNLHLSHYKLITLIIYRFQSTKLESIKLSLYVITFRI